MFAMTIQQRLQALAALILWSVLCFGAGFAYEWHRASVAQAEVQAKQDTAQATVTTTVKTTDTQAVKRLQAQLQASTAQTEALQQIINEAKNADHFDADCRLPERVRDSINSSLAASPQ